MDARRQDSVGSFGLLILRLGFGGLMAIHGWGKVQMLLDEQGDTFPDLLGGLLGMELGGQLNLALAAGAEFVCAILVMAGLLTRLAALPVAATMAMAAFVAHENDPWTMGEAFLVWAADNTKFPASKEPALLFLIPFLALVFTGAGRFSIDALIWPPRDNNPQRG